MSLFQLFLLFQEYRHDNCLKRPWPRDHHPRLDMQLRAIKEPVEERLIGFRKCLLNGIQRRRSASMRWLNGGSVLPMAYVLLRVVR
jgi:hypothetical protein